MARLLAIALFAAFVIPNTTLGVLHAQGRGGMNRGMGGMNRGPGVVRTMPSPVTAMPSPVTAPGPAFVGRPATGFNSFNRGFNGSFNGTFNGHRGFGAPGVVGAPGFHSGRRFPGSIARQPFGGFYSPFIWDAPIYSTPAYVDPGYIDPTYAAPQVNQNEIDLQYQVQALSEEVERLRQQQQEQQQQQPVVILPEPSPPAAPAPVVPAIPATLVFRNGHRTSIQNFAIVGPTLWVLDDGTTTKIPLSELNLQATRDENRSKGVRFPLPER
jgi:hypothetical protein